MFPSDTRTIFEQEINDAGGQNINDDLVPAVSPNPIRGIVSTDVSYDADCSRNCSIAHLISPPPITYRAHMENVG
jgi:hypothetical protein